MITETSPSSADLDQTASEETISSGSSLFCYFYKHIVNSNLDNLHLLCNYFWHTVELDLVLVIYVLRVNAIVYF